MDIPIVLGAVCRKKGIKTMDKWSYKMTKCNYCHVNKTKSISGTCKECQEYLEYVK